MSNALPAALIDTHCHLDFPEFDADRAAVLARAGEKGVGYVINIGSSLAGSRNSVRLAEEYDNVFATVGCHPHDAKDCSDADTAELRVLAQAGKVVAIGEIGLDYYRNLSPHDSQRTLFASLLALAGELGLPAVIHSRDAHEETLGILKEQKIERAIVHCFGSDEKFLRECLDRGYYVSFTCNITYKKADQLRQVVRNVPLERMCLETDAPYLSPEGFRGKRNEPSFVRLLAEEVARIRGTSVEEIARATTENAKTFFNLRGISV
ncbi:MAG: TatD family hydrolase [Candidatus Omnitrophica bacterium]|nr:TatD family hydrolase [Candidatus Omnitrophota bacterium]